MQNQKNYLSKEKEVELQAELTRLKTVERKEVAGHLEYAKSLGDLSENAEYHEARDKQADIEDRIQQIEEILKDAVIVSDKHGVAIDVGSVVVLEKAGGKKVEYHIVGSEEADLANNKISYQSPIGGSIIGKHKGEEVLVQTPNGKVTYSIVEVK